MTPEETIVAAAADAPAAAPAAQTPKTLDPFAGIGAGGKKETPAESNVAGNAKGLVEKTVEAKTKPAADAKSIEKKVAVRKDPLVEMRTGIEEKTKIIATKDGEIESLRKEISELKTRGGGDVGALTKTLQSKDKEIETLRGELASRDYSKHPDYLNKYEKPYLDAAKQGQKIFESLRVKYEQDGEPKVRPADWKKDFAPIFQMPREAAIDRANELFGENSIAANNTITQYDRLHELKEYKENALKEWQTGATERETKTRSEQILQDQNKSKAFELVSKHLFDNDTMYQIPPDDAELNELAKQSDAIVRRAFFERQKLTQQDAVILDAAIYRRAVNEPVLRARLQKALDELADYKERFEGKEASKNGKTRRSADATKPEKSEDWKKELLGDLKSAA